MNHQSERRGGNKMLSNKQRSEVKMEWGRVEEGGVGFEENF